MKLHMSVLMIALVALSGCAYGVEYTQDKPVSIPDAAVVDAGMNEDVEVDSNSTIDVFSFPQKIDANTYSPIYTCLPPPDNNYYIECDDLNPDDCVLKNCRIQDNVSICVNGKCIQN